MLLDFPIHDLELAALVFALRIEALFIWSTCRIFKDYKSL